MNASLVSGNPSPVSTLSVIASLSADASTFGDVCAFVERARRLGVTEASPLFDGGHTRVVGHSEEAGGTLASEHYGTFGAVVSWVERLRAEGVEPDAPLEVGGDVLAVDLPVTGVVEDSTGDSHRLSVSVGHR